MEIRLYFQMLRRGWWIILLTALTALVASLGASYLATPQYRSVARFILTPNIIEASGPDTVLRSISTLGNTTVMNTYAEVMKSRRTYEDALTFMQLQRGDLVGYSYEAEVLSDSSVLELIVTGPNPQLAAEMANSIGYQTIGFTRSLNQVFNLDFLDTAVPSFYPVSPQPVRDALLALVFGVFGGVALVILNDQIRFSLEAFGRRLQLDPVTGVYNSKHFFRLVEEELAQSPQGVLTVGIVELDGIRELFETVPSVSLQRILHRATEALRKELRGHDVIGRWNEISFIVMLPNTSGGAATRIFERISEALSTPVDLGNLFDVKVNLDPLIGGAEYGSGISAEELLEKANSALERARKDNTNPIYVWEMKNPFWAQKKAIEE